MKTKTVTKKENRKGLLAKQGFCFLLLFMFSTLYTFAQLTGYKYKDAINVKENAGSQKINYQVLLNINTAALVTAGKMQATGNDIRFAKNCNGSQHYNYWIESGINTANTQIWVLVDTLPASKSRIMYMWYGNSSAAAASNFDSTFPVATRLIDTSAVPLALTGTRNYSWFQIGIKATLNVGPDTVFKITARKIMVDGIISGNGSGFVGGASSSNGNGPGGGKAETFNSGLNGGGGGSYGDSGGRGSEPTGTPANQFGQPGPLYGTNNTDSIDMGSSGAGGAATGGAGGGSITLWADVIEISGTINDNGSAGTPTGAFGGGGGGAGGGVRIKGNQVIFSGIINADGANGGLGGYGGGGGGGGRIKIFSDASVVNSGTEFVIGGSPGSSNPANIPGTKGQTGTTFQGTFASKVPTYTMLPHIGALTASSNPVCAGTPVTFTVVTPGGFSAFNFYVGKISKQNTAANTYTDNTPKNMDTVKVLAKDVNGCMDTSNVINMTVNPAPVTLVTPDTATICKSGGSVSLTASGATSYAWSPATGLSATTGATVTANPTTTTSYIITGTGSNGCTATDTATVSVQICTGIQQTVSANFGFRSYPTLTQGAFTIEADFGNMQTTVVIELNNILGQRVKTIENTTISGHYTKVVNIADMPDGVYFLALKTESATEIQKLLKN